LGRTPSKDGGAGTSGTWSPASEPHAIAAETGPIGTEIGAPLLGIQALLPKGRYFRRNDQSSEASSPLEAMAKELAVQLESYSPPRIAIVTEVSRSGFWVSLGVSDGIKAGLRAEVERLRPESPLGPRDVARAFADGKLTRGLLTGHTSSITRARVSEVRSDSTYLRYADPHRWRKVRKGDIVTILGSRFRLCVGGISGAMPVEATEALRSILLEELEESEIVTPLRGPYEPSGIAWSEGQAAALCNAGASEDCGYAAAGAVTLSGDKLHAALALVEVSSCETVGFITTSVAADPALAAIMSRPGPEHGGPEHRDPGAATGSWEPYETGLRPAISVELRRPAVAVHVLGETGLLCVGGRNSLELYRLDPEGRSLVSDSVYDIEYSSPPIPCRDPAGRIDRTDSDGDGRDELVFRHSGSRSPVAFSCAEGPDGRGVSLEPADSYWLPWSGPYGDMSYVPGTNFMTAGSDEGEVEFYDVGSGDIDGDGDRENVFTETSGALTIEDALGRVLIKANDVGAPLEICDMNLDGAPEIVASARSRPAERDDVIFYNYGDGGLLESWRAEGIPGSIISMAAGKLDGDELPDLAILLRMDLRAETTGLIVMLTAR